MPMGAELTLLSVALLGPFCPFPVPDCHLQNDLNCDRKDVRHCKAYDIDGANPGDCTPDGRIDDFWLFADGDGDLIADPCNPADLVLLQPDLAADGWFYNPACDHWSDDIVQGAQGTTMLRVPDASTVEVHSSSVYPVFDLARGDVAGLSFGAGIVDLGSVTCLANDVEWTGINEFIAFPDPVFPPPGAVYFYVARFWGSGGTTSGHFYPYGYGECQERVVRPGNGDCEM